MTDFSYSAEITINATPQAIFDIVSDPANHARLAGSEELNKITQSPAGPVGLGTHIMAEETVMMADGTGMDLTANSIVSPSTPPTLSPSSSIRPFQKPSAGSSGGSTWRPKVAAPK